MKELTGKIEGLNIDYATGKINLTFAVNERHGAKSCYEEFKDAEKLSIKVAKYRKKRSLDSNGYFWKLLDQLSEKINVPKTEIYRSYIKEIGGVSETVCVINEAVEKLCNGWSHNGLGWQTDTTPSKLKGCTNVVLYYGSSMYNTEQMSRLISMVVEDCKAQGIETKTPEELAHMLLLWEAGEK